MKTILTIILFLYCTGLYAVTSVDLFDQNRGQEKEEKPVTKKPVRKKQIRSRRDSFSLIGISKIGDKHVIHLSNVKGKQDTFTWYEHQKSPAAKVYDDYEIDKIINRTLYLNIIKNKPCIEDEKQGISCDKKNKQMIMKLVRKKAITPPRSARAKRNMKKTAIKKPVKAAAKSTERKPFKWQQKKK